VRQRIVVIITALAASAMLAAGCSSSADEPAAAADPTRTSSEPAPTDPTANEGSKQDGAVDPLDHGHSENPDGPAPQPLRTGERFVELAMPEPYTPSAPYGTGTDDYRCFLLDPALTSSAFVTGVNVLPGNADVVHHVILFRVPPDDVAVAEDKDASEPGQGWTCFGGTGLDAELGGDLDTAPWIGAWAPGGGESVLPGDIGIPLEPGTRIIMQVHYNLLAGSAADVSSTQLRLAPGDADLAALETMLLPAPVELPCRPQHADGPLCDREASVADVLDRFGPNAGWMVSGLQLLCGGNGGTPKAGEVQHCDRQVRTPMTVRAVAGHMHLLGREISVEVNPGRPDGRTLLDIPVWNFDDQGAVPLSRPAEVQAGDTLRVTCRHSQRLRDLLPAFEGQPDRYVVWGDGTTDEMCLGILLVTRP
jgi:Copper type II ascorbate-dependent monooxygenase, N-terminal domain